MLWALQQGIVKGTGANEFSPEAICTRAQTVAILYRYAKSPAVSGGKNFADVNEGTYYSNAVNWAFEKRITSGTDVNLFSPDKHIVGRICKNSRSYSTYIELLFIKDVIYGI